MHDGLKLVLVACVVMFAVSLYHDQKSKQPASSEQLKAAFSASECVRLDLKALYGSDVISKKALETSKEKCSAVNNQAAAFADSK
jgi:uncharacterized membrane protein